MSILQLLFESVSKLSKILFLNSVFISFEWSSFIVEDVGTWIFVMYACILHAYDVKF